MTDDVLLKELEWYRDFRRHLTRDSEFPPSWSSLKDRTWYIREVTLENKVDPQNMINAGVKLADVVDKFLTGIMTRDDLQKAWRKWCEARTP